MDNQVLNKILEICIPILTALFVPVVVALFKHYWSLADAALESKNKTQWEFVKSVIVQAVNYAEQKGLLLAAETAGQEKLKLATQFVEAALATKGIQLDLYPIVSMIEAAVMQEFNYEKTLSAPAPEVPVKAA